MNHSVVVLPGYELLCCGGEDKGVLGDLYKVDCSTLQWGKAKAAFPPRSGHQTVFFRGTVLVFGGVGPDRQPATEVLLVNGEGLTCERLEPAGAIPSDFGQLAVCGDQVLSVRPGSEYSSFNVRTGVWASLATVFHPGLIATERYLAAVLSPDLSELGLMAREERRVLPVANGQTVAAREQLCLAYKQDHSVIFGYGGSDAACMGDLWLLDYSAKCTFSGADVVCRLDHLLCSAELGPDLTADAGCLDQIGELIACLPQSAEALCYEHFLSQLKKINSTAEIMEYWVKGKALLASISKKYPEIGVLDKAVAARLDRLRALSKKNTSLRSIVGCP